jgi:hypothetical protein
MTSTTTKPVKIYDALLKSQNIFVCTEKSIYDIKPLDRKTGEYTTEDGKIYQTLIITIDIISVPIYMHAITEEYKSVNTTATFKMHCDENTTVFFFNNENTNVYMHYNNETQQVHKINYVAY